MSDMDDELRQILQRIGDQAKPADLVQRSLSTARLVRRRRAGVAIGAAAVVVATLSIGGWSIANRNHADGGLLPATSPTASGNLPSPSATASTSASPFASPSASPSASSASAAAVAPVVSSPAPAPVSLQILVSPELSTPGQDATDLLPTSCTFTQTQRSGAGVVTAKGTFGPYYETYNRYGDVVELYVFTGTPKTNPTTTQLAQLPNPSEPPLSTGSWQVSAPIVAPPSQPLFCLVAVQSTHAFIGSPSG
jgi:hypothetical protein